MITTTTMMIIIIIIMTGGGGRGGGGEEMSATTVSFHTFSNLPLSTTRPFAATQSVPNTVIDQNKCYFLPLHRILSSTAHDS